MSDYIDRTVEYLNRMPEKFQAIALPTILEHECIKDYQQRKLEKKGRL
jgi:hypothetical protein